MQILSYGEDAYTLWALRNQLPTILNELQDLSSYSECKVIFRPSFGRRSGDKSAQFGEFDFILISRTHTYLGESKWDRSSELKGESLFLRDEQKRRHHILTYYIKSWFEQDFVSWENFIVYIGQETVINSHKIKTAPVGSRLAENLYSFLKLLKDQFNKRTPEIENILLYLYRGDDLSKTPTTINNGFNLIKVDYSGGLFEASNYIDLNR
ncbi:hypothetical protein JF544_10030 [Halobacillus kuroshimensis]|uniref:NERD domain-containing protein n=1 Tax=Halobacillus kuroshimensis TaxID=302481 RepID=A0ABS3DWA4_9BACI|nr:hypothetical protein [Halobacillus kuroshimensis]MBN8235586.1 hypothetical protein [Halobacillus kuroshimensis]